jgi:acyl-CoA thioesterase
VQNSIAIFEPDGDNFVPTANALSFWGSDRLHGGSITGALAYACESVASDAELRLSRLTVDLFGPVPNALLSVRVEKIRESRRVLLLDASLLFANSAVARASALFFRNRNSVPAKLNPNKPQGPDSLAITSLFRDADSSDILPGFHLTVQTRWVPRQNSEPLAIWFRLPVPLVSGRTTSSVVQAAALSDLGNAVATFDAMERNPSAAAYINVDTTMYFDRNPVGEWFCLRVERQSEYAGSSIVEVSHFDAQGYFARSLQSRLAYAFT